MYVRTYMHMHMSTAVYFMCHKSVYIHSCVGTYIDTYMYLNVSAHIRIVRSTSQESGPKSKLFDNAHVWMTIVCCLLIINE